MLVVAALVSPYLVGLAAAETVHTKTVDASGARYVIVDGGDISGEFTIEMTVPGDEIPDENQDTVIVRKTVGDGYAIQEFAFVNAGAYETVEVRVTVPTGSSGSPTFGTGADFVEPYQRFASSGGDADLDCDLAESIGSFTTNIVDCRGLPSQGVNTTELDANETKISIYQQMATSKVRTQMNNNSFHNNLEGYKNDAIIAGKNAYVRALVNGTSEPVARSRAREAVRDYWARMQVGILNEWSVMAEQAVYLRSSANTSSGVNQDFIHFGINGKDSDDNSDVRWWEAREGHSVSLVNNTDANTTIIWAPYPDGTQEGSPYSLHPGFEWSRQGGGFEVGYLSVSEAPYESGKVALDKALWNSRWYDIENASTSTVDHVDTFANETYEAYQNGTISTADLIDPYLAQKHYAPEDGSDYQTWALSSLSRLGVSTPSTLENTGRMVVEDHAANRTLEGILLSDKLPNNDTFAVGQTYNASTLGGGQYVVTADGTVELTGEFTPTEFVTKDGTEQQSVTYRNITYETANLTEYAALMETLQTQQAEIDALQEEARDGGGGIGGGDGLLSGLVAGLAGFLGVSREVALVGGGAAVVGGGYLLLGGS
ncbi:hypothetical protein [Halorarius halobius]|uniref:hypothetical protein n=1 Tax=Halorarius halobius TaxID=2962671 RepID=UPI0020CC514A|nr:hypothetical protein [Halorarius halobius]